MDLSGVPTGDLNAELLRRTGSVDSLDPLFGLPSWVDDPVLRDQYEIIVARLRREIEHVPLSTLQQLRIERITFNYIVLKYREAHADTGFEFADQLKDWSTYWAAITREFDLVLKAWKPRDQDAIMAVVKALVTEIVSTVDNSEVRNDLVRRFVDSFQRAGLTK
jgi:hypothetical protein